MSPEQHFLRTAQSAGIPAGLAEESVRLALAARLWLDAQARHTQPAPAFMREGMKDWCERLMRASSEAQCREILKDFAGSLMEGHPQPSDVSSSEKIQLGIRLIGVGFSRGQIIGLVSKTTAYETKWPNALSWDTLQRATETLFHDPWVRASFPAWSLTAFIDRAREQGLSPEATWFLATTRADLARPGLLPQAAVLDYVQAVEDVEGIDAITSSAAFQQWLQHQPNDVRDSFNDAVEVGMSWDDVVTSLSYPTHPPLDLDTPVRGSSTTEEAWQALERAAAHAGLNGINWHMNDGAEREILDRYAAEITAVNQNLARTVGWDGGVMGLAGLVRIRLNDPTIRGGGEQSSDKYGLTITSNAKGGGWRVMAHEWLHALDEAIGRHWHTTSVLHASDKPSDLPPGLHHSMVALLDRMGQGSFSRAAHEGMLQAVEARFVSRWKDVAPQTIAWAQTQPRDVVFGQSLKEWGKRLQELDPSTTALHRSALSLEAHMVGHQDMPSDGRVMWRHFSDRWKQHCTTTWKTTMADMAGYFEEPTEMLAYAFECISEGPGFSGAAPRSLYERTAEETRINAPAFQTFFRALDGHWSSLRPVAVDLAPSSPAQLGNRLRERRNAASPGATVSQEPALAPEAVPMGERLRARRGTSTAAETAVEREAARLRR